MLVSPSIFLNVHIAYLWAPTLQAFDGNQGKLTAYDICNVFISLLLYLYLTNDYYVSHILHNSSVPKYAHIVIHNKCVFAD